MQHCTPATFHGPRSLSLVRNHHRRWPADAWENVNHSWGEDPDWQTTDHRTKASPWRAFCWCTALAHSWWLSSNTDSDLKGTLQKPQKWEGKLKRLLDFPAGDIPHWKALVTLKIQSALLTDEGITALGISKGTVLVKHIARKTNLK